MPRQQAAAKLMDAQIQRVPLVLYATMTAIGIVSWTHPDVRAMRAATSNETRTLKAHEIAALAGIVATIILGSRTVSAQRVDLLGRPKQITAINGRALAPIRFATASPAGQVLILGGPSRQDMFLIDRMGFTRAEPTTLLGSDGHLGWPAAAAFDGPNRILVIDTQSPRLARVHLVNGKWAIDSVFMTGLSGISGICSIAGRQYIMAKLGSSREKGAVHEVTRDGAVKRSFGKPFGSINNPAVGYGHLLCLAEPRSVVIVSRLFPEIRAYTLDGVLRWSAPLPDFRPMGFSVEGRLVRFTYSPDSLWDETVALFSPSSQVIAVQIARQVGRAYSTQYRFLRTVFLSAKTGALLGDQRDLPVVLAALQGSLYAVDQRNGGALRILYFRWHAP